MYYGRKEYENYRVHFFDLPIKEKELKLASGILDGLDINILLAYQLRESKDDETNKLSKIILSKYTVDATTRLYEDMMECALYGKDTILVKLMERQKGQPFYNKVKFIKQIILDKNVTMIHYILQKSIYKDAYRIIMPKVLDNIDKNRIYYLMRTELKEFL